MVIEGANNKPRWLIQDLEKNSTTAESLEKTSESLQKTSEALEKTSKALEEPTVESLETSLNSDISDSDDDSESIIHDLDNDEKYKKTFNKNDTKIKDLEVETLNIGNTELGEKKPSDKDIDKEADKEADKEVGEEADKDVDKEDEQKNSKNIKFKENTTNSQSDDIKNLKKDISLAINEKKVETKNEKVLFDLGELNEVDINISDNKGVLNLKPPSEVYNAINKEVRKKAKEAKRQAIEAFLEVKRIKSLYGLEDIDSSDEENSNENQ